MGAIGAALSAWPFINSMNPAADVLALSSIEVDIAPIALGQRITVKWRSQPVFIAHRTPEEIQKSVAVDWHELRDPQPDSARAQKPEWLIMIGICTHLGCVPLGQKQGDPRGEWGGWFCPCHGSQYDTAGRIRKGPAPLNLILPAYTYLTDKSVKIG
jgi:ubiquinol-cytochrome c reductase iron-sulfur subunit